MNLNKKKVFFHSITGNTLNESSDDSARDPENSELMEINHQNINDFTDICEKDKIFFCLWGKFVYNK